MTLTTEEACGIISNLEKF